MLLKKCLKNIKFEFILCLIVCLSFIQNADAAEYYTEKPEWLKSCKIYEPGFTKCSTESIQGLMDRLTHDGIPEITAEYGSIDPIKLDKVVFKGNNNQAANIAANLTDLVAKGLTKLVIKESRVSKKDFSWETKVFLPNMRLDGNYKMSGKILLIPLNGAGKIFLDIDNMDILMHTKVRLYEKGGFTFYNVTRIRVDLKVGGIKSNLENIFNGNSKELEKSTNDLFNENWRDFFEALRPIITETVETLLTKIMKSTFDLIPANFIVEDIPKSTELYKTKTQGQSK